MYSEPPLGGTVAYVRSAAPSLGPSEQRVAQACIERPEEVAGWSAADLASAAGTAPSTVVRACQAMGFNGFQQLRFLLVRDQGAAATAPVQESVDLLDGVLHRISRGLQSAIATVDRDRFAEVVAKLAAARRIVVTANGASGPVAQSFRDRLLVMGVPCEAPSDAVIQQVIVRQLGPDDVVVAISDSGMNQVTLEVAESARAGEATLIALTSYARSDLSALADLTLVLGASESIASGVATHVIAQLVVLNALELALQQTLGGDDTLPMKIIDQIFGHIVRPE